MTETYMFPFKYIIYLRERIISHSANEKFAVGTATSDIVRRIWSTVKVVDLIQTMSWASNFWKSYFTVIDRNKYHRHFKMPY